MSVNYYTADLHFNHTFVAGTRNYESSEAHDEDLIERFNREVRKRDHLWILGDLCMGSLTKGLEQASRLNGVKHLVLGNHDTGHPMHKGSHNSMRRYLEVFDSVHLHEQHTIEGLKVNLSHFPYWGDHKPSDRHSEWRLPDCGTPLLHGHVHAEWLLNEHLFNVGVDHGMAPIHRDVVAEWLKP